MSDDAEIQVLCCRPAIDGNPSVETSRKLRRELRDGTHRANSEVGSVRSSV